MTDQELRELLAETAQLTAQNSKQIKQLGKQIGELGNKFGKFTEGLFFPSIVRILSDRFSITNTTSRVRVTDPETREVVMELDGFGYANSAKNIAVVIEIKTELREENLQNFLDKLGKFPAVFPEHRDKTVYGVIAATILPDDLRAKALKNGLFVASISDEAFRLTAEPAAPKDFS